MVPVEMRAEVACLSLPLGLGVEGDEEIVPVGTKVPVEVLSAGCEAEVDCFGDE